MVSAINFCRKHLDLILLSLVFLAYVLIFLHTFTSMVAIWEGSQNFTHGYFVYPIAGYLVWLKRLELLNVIRKFSPAFLTLLIPLGFLWLLAEFASVQLVAHFSVVLMLPVIVAAFLGLRFARALAFPLGFTLFAVPSGDFMIDPLMDLTADVTVYVLRSMGIPVFQEGLFFVLPTGTWSVIEACSGFRYVTVSVVLGTLFSYLQFQKNTWRIGFVVACVLTAIIANFVRAVCIVLTGHLTGMTFGAGTEHIVFGWVLFGIMIFALFFFGAKIADRFDTPVATSQHNLSDNLLAMTEPQGQNADIGRGIMTLFLAMLLLAIWPAWENLSQSRATNLVASFTVPSLPYEKVVSNEQLSWTPHFVGNVELRRHRYQLQSGNIELITAFYAEQKQGSELINFQNQLVAPGTHTWRNVKSDSSKRLGDPLQSCLNEYVLVSNHSRLLVWQWYFVSDRLVCSALEVKALEAIERLAGESASGTSIFVLTEFDGINKQTAEERLMRFAKAILPRIMAANNTSSAINLEGF